MTCYRGAQTCKLDQIGDMSVIVANASQAGRLKPDIRLAQSVSRFNKFTLANRSFILKPVHRQRYSVLQMLAM